MKNQREIYQALLDGRTLQNIKTHIKVKIPDDNSDIRQSFSFPEDWEIYDEYHKLKKAFKEGAYIEFYSTIYNDWRIPPYTKPLWRDGIKYRIKGDISIDAWNKWKECIKAYWNDKTIEYKLDSIEDEWSKVDEPHFVMNSDLDYRIKPEPTLYYRWKKQEKTKRVYVSPYWYEEGKKPDERDWTRIEPGKTLEEIG